MRSRNARRRLRRVHVRSKHAFRLHACHGARLLGVLLRLVVVDFPRHPNMHGIPPTRFLRLNKITNLLTSPCSLNFPKQATTKKSVHDNKMIEKCYFFPQQQFPYHVNKIKKIIIKNINLPLVWVLWDQLRLEDLAAELLNGF